MNRSDCNSLPAKYRPQTLKQVRGQTEAVAALTAFVNATRPPRIAAGSAVFLFYGPSGVGKTSAAWALAFDLGCDPDDPYMSGVNELPSGSQDGAAVEQLLRQLITRPLFGSGWKVVIVNEADRMTPQAETIWLDGLENLPPRTVVVFTTNDVSRLASRFVSRCECLPFHGSPAIVNGAFARFIRYVWRKETGQELTIIPDGLGVFDIAGGTLSFRLALQQLAPYCRSGRPLPDRFQPPIVRDSDSAKQDVFRQAAAKAVATRRANQQQPTEV
jgi:hypothetical protein